MSDVLLRDLIDIPESVHKSDFVISLTDGVDEADQTLSTYVVTEQIASCFDSALGLIGTALADHSSKGAYLHGSFGSGKSHFMAVLHLLLQGDSRARSIPELAPVIDKRDPNLAGRNFLLVPYHMIGAASMEAGILGGYVEHVRELHPEAPLPAVFVADGIIEDAQKLRTQMGDQAFFDALGGSGGDDDGFGDFAAGWDPTSFDAAVQAGPKSEERERLVSDLIDTFYTTYRTASETSGGGYVPFDDGLAAISRHAKSLGYDAVVLFLDELILWFATRMADPTFVQTEGPKVAKLVEAPDKDRPAPLVSFIARQRDLRDFVGQGIPGAEKLNFGQILEYWEGRFDTIELADRNLTAIVEKRLLKAKDESAERALDRAFEATASKAGAAVDTLLTTDADREAFRRVYPFSPALVDALVAVSGYLQRERTALRLLLQLLVDQRDTLTVGDLVPLGDLYDVIKTGEEPFSEELKRHFNRARSLYHTRMRPILLNEHGLTEDDVADLPDRHAFRTDDRLAKTLLLAALVPSAEPLRNLTVRRLADLNHGSIRTPIPGQERAAVLGRVRKWQQEIGELRVEGDEQDPTVSLRLSGVDTEGILDQARTADSTGARRAKTRQLVAESLGLEESGGLTPATYQLVWRGGRRTVEVKFANVRDDRDIPDTEFRAGDHPRVIIDFPFDEDPERGPSDDLARVDKLRERMDPSPTICWLPLHLTDQALDRLGRLVVIDHVLTGDNYDRFSTHLSPNDRVEARQIIENQARALRQQIRDILRQAYGIEKPTEQWVRTDLAPKQQYPTLDPTLSLQPPVATGLAEAFDGLLDQLFRHLHPRHPDFGDEVRIGELRTALSYVSKAVQTQSGRVDVPTPDRKAVRKLLGPLQIAVTGEAHLQLGRDWIDHFHIKAREHDATTITVRQLKQWIDEPESMGLDDRVANLVVAAYALQDDRVLVQHGTPIEPTVDRLDTNVELRTQKLPPEDAWERATERAQTVFGVPARPIRNAASVAALVTALKEQAHELVEPCRSLVPAVEGALQRIGIDNSADRLATAVAGRTLVEGIRDADDVDAVTFLADLEVPTSTQALGRSLKSAAQVAAVLERTNWKLLDSAMGLSDDRAGRANDLRTQLVEALTSDELAQPLSDAIRDAEATATDLLAAPKPPPEPPAPPKTPDPTPGPASSLPAHGRRDGLAGDDARDVLRELIDRADDLERLDVEWDLRT